MEGEPAAVEVTFPVPPDDLGSVLVLYRDEDEWVIGALGGASGSPWGVRSR